MSEMLDTVYPPMGQDPHHALITLSRVCNPELGSPQGARKCLQERDTFLKYWHPGQPEPHCLSWDGLTVPHFSCACETGIPRCREEYGSTKSLRNDFWENIAYCPWVWQECWLS
jgi:hypothetical protein